MAVRTTVAAATVEIDPRPATLGAALDFVFIPGKKVESFAKRLVIISCKTTAFVRVFLLI